MLEELFSITRYSSFCLLVLEIAVRGSAELLPILESVKPFARDETGSLSTSILVG